MAELVVRSRAQSSLRQVTETALNALFPVWGIASPLFAMIAVGALVVELRSTMLDTFVQTAALLGLCLTFTVGCLLVKMLLAKDYLIVDKEGIHLPFLAGGTINLRRNIPWRRIARLQAVVNHRQPGASKIAIHMRSGASRSLPTKSLDAHIVEQFVLAAKMWNPDLCDASLDDLQDALRGSQHKDREASYTALWEEELSRRFSPTAYIGLEPGKQLRNNSLRVVSHLASGGLSALYLAQLDNNRLVVLKEAVIPQETIESIKEKAQELFDREADLLMKLNNPAIVKVLDRFTENERNYLMLEYVNGTDLRQLVKQNGAQKESDVIDWAIQIANGLKYLHEREAPIVHRDLTPDNIVLRSDGQLVIVDFGAANELIGNATGTFVGKHSYIAPEQFRGKASTSSDVYAFGCTLFYLLTGEEPEALTPSIPRADNAAVSAELSELVESCTQLEASDRYQSFAQMIPVLKRLASQSIVL